jgi:CheY-like chemotaxis protein
MFTSVSSEKRLILPRVSAAFGDLQAIVGFHDLVEAKDVESPFQIVHAGAGCDRSYLNKTGKMAECLFGGGIAPFIGAVQLVARNFLNFLTPLPIYEKSEEKKMAAAALDLEQDELECLPRATSLAAKEQECVLLIEDSEEAMVLVRYALREHGKGRYRLEWANNLSTGLDQLAHGGVDLVLLDLGLPESSGPESYAWVREIAPQVPVVVLTGDEREETEFAVTASGVEGYLVKDQVSGTLLIQAIRAALYANKQQRKKGNKQGGDMVRKLLTPYFRIES